ncbi:hypothetical protein SM74_05079, partial [Klebsiella variicola]
ENNLCNLLKYPCVGIVTGSTGNNDTFFGCFEFIQSFTPVISRATIRHQENEWTPVAFCLRCRFLNFCINSVCSQG